MENGKKKSLQQKIKEFEKIDENQRKNQGMCKNIAYTTFTNFSIKYLVMCMVYTDDGGIKKLYHVCPPVRKIIHSLKLVDYLHVQAHNPWYNYYLISYQNI